MTEQKNVATENRKKFKIHVRKTKKKFITSLKVTVNSMFGLCVHKSKVSWLGIECTNLKKYCTVQ